MRARWFVVSGLGTLAACGDSTSSTPEYRADVFAGSEQSGQVGDTLPVPIAVRVTNSAGVPQPDISVTWSTSEYYGAIIPAEGVTDADGVARSRWVLGIGGDQAATATVGSEALVVTFHATESPAFRAVALMHGDPDTHMCALDAQQRAWCWGINKHGELGNASVPLGTDPTETPVLVAGHHQFSSLIGSNGISCGLDTSHQLWCWGRDILSDRSSPAVIYQEPVAVQAGLSFVTVDLSWSNQACGVLANGEAYCWGTGYMGDGQGWQTSATPIAVGSDANWQSIAMGGTGACGVKTDHTLWCWGTNWEPVPIPGLPGGPMLSPVMVTGLAHVARVDANFEEICFTSGAPSTTGTCYGEVPNDAPLPRFDPVSSVWATDQTIIGLTTDARIEIWGVIGEYQDVVSPVTALPGSGWQEASGNDLRLYGILAADGGVYEMNIVNDGMHDHAYVRAVPEGMP
jgi:hypothetical protein